ncbi:hypothetical protein [Halorubellus salinus]|uniref:hypothetical protein n=1 Tax=Halorubellus salinus TaxID=755309 RepID=UPI001D08CADF|nr:hypothetical protein [Halorubellus salinus]
MKRREVLGVLGVAGTGGCLRLSEGGTTTTVARSTRQTQAATSTSTDTGTTATRTSETGERDPDLPSGLSADGVGNYLFDYHLRELGQRSFATNWTLLNQRREIVKLRREYRVGDAGAVGSWTFDEGGPVTMFRSTDGGFWREDIGDEYSYGKARDGYDMERLTLAAWVRPFIAGGVWSAPSLVRRESPARWETQVTGFEADASVPGWFNGELESLSGSMVVDERGFIRSLDGEMTASGTNVGRQEYGVRYAVDSVDDVTVREPDWLPTAKERRPRVSVVLTDDEYAVRLTHESGNPIEANTNLIIYDEAARRNEISYPLGEPIESGETVYLYTEESGGFNGQLSRGTPPASSDAIRLDSEYTAWADRSGTEYFGTAPV